MTILERSPRRNAATLLALACAVLLAAGFAGADDAKQEKLDLAAVKSLETPSFVVPDSGVGGYYNTALDLLFNMIGAILAVVLINVRAAARRRAAQEPTA